jgi:hypothetical protein
LLRWELSRQHLPMTSEDSARIRVRRGAIIGVAVAAATASFIAVTGVANGATAQRQPGFGAAARIAVGQAAARLAPGPGRSGRALLR